MAEADALEDDRIDVDQYQDGLEDEDLADARDMEDDLRGVASVAAPDGAARCDVNPGL